MLGQTTLRIFKRFSAHSHGSGATEIAFFLLPQPSLARDPLDLLPFPRPSAYLNNIGGRSVTILHATAMCATQYREPCCPTLVKYNYNDVWCVDSVWGPVPHPTSGHTLPSYTSFRPHTYTRPGSSSTLPLTHLIL